ncbi:MAG: methyltransferase domain-containing protein [Patescibacteria group bacterium]
MNKFFNTIKAAMKGQSIYRALSQQVLKENCPILSGQVIDLAGGGKNNYFTCLNLQNAQYRNTDIKEKPGVDLILDLAQPLPLSDGSFDSALLFNCLYIFANPEQVLQGINRIIKPGGFLLLITPFVFNEAPEPTDYWRLTSQGLRQVLSEAGFNDIKIIPFGERFSVAVSVLNKFLFFRPCRALIYLAAMALDKVVPAGVKKNHPLPLGYLTICLKAF